MNPGGGTYGSDDSSTSEMSVEAVKAAKEEEAMEKADEGDFIGDICIVCAFGLPKVDDIKKEEGNIWGNGLMQLHH